MEDELTNLYEETVEILKANDKTMDDIVWVGTRKGYMPVGEFLKVAKKTNYDAGYGGSEILDNLLVVGKDWWLERHEYDGSEWWEYKTLPIKPTEILKTSIIYE